MDNDDLLSYMAMDQYLYIPFLGGWTSINPSYDLGFTRYQGFDPSPYVYVMLICICYNTWRMVMTDMDNDDCGIERQGGFLEYMDNK